MATAVSFSKCSKSSKTSLSLGHISHMNVIALHDGKVGSRAVRMICCLQGYAEGLLYQVSIAQCGGWVVKLSQTIAPDSAQERSEHHNGGNINSSFGLNGLRTALF
jgi:hypothetical protein